jgi:branched-subunit amino acid aminotransferase/4-amino-4-deoxychorismate lyase
MAGFIGVDWAPKQMKIELAKPERVLLPIDSGAFAISRSIHYGACLVFEGIRFFVTEESGTLEVVFANLASNLARFRRGISFNLSDAQQSMLPTEDAIHEMILDYLASPEMRSFMSGMARDAAQGYLRPFTVDEELSIGVTFPANPGVRMVAARYDSYLGEPFSGVAVPNLVRAFAGNGTGCLKLGVNYLMSVKAIQAARRIRPSAASALFLDDQPGANLRDRLVTEWDSSCFMVGFRDGVVVKIAESPLILPSVTVQGIVCLLREEGVEVQEREMTYGELVDRARADEIAVLASIGTAGILNRASSLLLVDGEGEVLAEARSDEASALYEAMGRARTAFWDVYRSARPAPAGMDVTRHAIGSAED